MCKIIDLEGKCIPAYCPLGGAISMMNCDYKPKEPETKEDIEDINLLIALQTTKTN
jgi:hypothetical protein